MNDMARCKGCIHDNVCNRDVGHGYSVCPHYINTADVVEVVRCRDCKQSYFIKFCSKYECRKGCGTLKYANDFCSYGERKE